MIDSDPLLDELYERLGEIQDLSATSRVLMWDQATLMPPRGALGRARQLATISRLVHERQTDPGLGRLLDDLDHRRGGLPGGEMTGALLDVARRDFERFTRVPAELMVALRTHQSEGYEKWKRARPDNDFAAVKPVLDRTLELSRKLAACFPQYDHPADALIAHADFGMSAEWVSKQFAALRERLVPLVHRVCERPVERPSSLEQRFEPDDQLAFGHEVIEKLGYDFERGRQDLTAHPFMIRFSHGDIRITTRIDENDLGEALFGTIHETGHALYEQGIAAELDRTPLARGTSSGVHESQSRLWENIVGRSFGFWTHFYPQLQERFPAQLGDVDLDDFHRDINRVRRSLIRTDADELTYNLHVMLRFDLEVDLLSGNVDVADLPDVWGDRMEDMLGIRPPDDRDGVLQDVHWYSGYVGGEFQGYTLGNVMSAQFYAAARRDEPAIDDNVASGRFDRLLGWLTENVYRYGRSLPALELVEQATGEPFSINPYIDYLENKYTALYEL